MYTTNKTLINETLTSEFPVIQQLSGANILLSQLTFETVNCWSMKGGKPLPVTNQKTMQYVRKARVHVLGENLQYGVWLSQTGSALVTCCQAVKLSAR